MEDYPIKRLVQKAAKMHRKLRINCPQIDNILNFQHHKLCNQNKIIFCLIPCESVDYAFANAYKHLSNSEQAFFYYNYIKIVSEAMFAAKSVCFGNQSEQNSNASIEPELSRQQTFGQKSIDIDFQKEIKLQNFQISKMLPGLMEKWKHCRMILFRQLNIIRFSDNNDEIDLQHYILRKARTNKNTLVLEFTESFVKPSSLRIQCSKQTFDNVFHQLDTAIRKSIFDKVYRILSLKYKKELLSRSSLLSQQARLSDHQESKMYPLTLALIFGKKRLTLEELIKEANKEEIFSQEKMEKIMKKILGEMKQVSLSQLGGFERVRPDVLYQKKGRRVKKFFHLFKGGASMQSILDKFSRYENLGLWKPALYSIKRLCSIPSQNSEVYHEIDFYNNNILEAGYTFIRTFYQKTGHVFYFVDKSVGIYNKELWNLPEMVDDILITHCIWRFREINPNQLEILVDAELHFNHKNAQQLTQEFIGDPTLLFLPHEFQKTNQNCNHGESQTYSNQQFESKQNSGEDFYSIYSEEPGSSSKASTLYYSFKEKSSLIQQKMNSMVLMKKEDDEKSTQVVNYPQDSAKAGLNNKVERIISKLIGVQNVQSNRVKSEEDRVKSEEDRVKKQKHSDIKSEDGAKSGNNSKVSSDEDKQENQKQPKDKLWIGSQKVKMWSPKCKIESK